MSVENSPRPLAGETIRGDRVAVGEGIADPARKTQPLTPGFAVPSPLERAVINCSPSESKMYKLEAHGASHGFARPSLSPAPLPPARERVPKAAAPVPSQLNRKASPSWRPFMCSAFSDISSGSDY